MKLGDRLAYARKALNITLAKACKHTGIGISTLSEFEHGKREPKLSQLMRLADLYRRPLSFFLEESPIVPEVVVWRVWPKEPRAEEVQAQFLELVEQYHNLEVWCEDRQDSELPFAPWSAENFSYPDAEKLAHRVRNELGLGDRPGFTLLWVLEEVCHVKVIHLPLEPADAAACTWSDRYGAAVLLNSRNVRRRRNFDLAHQLFHLLTWHVFRWNDAGPMAQVNAEKEKLANCFASNLLMPGDALRLAISTRLGKGRTLGFHDVFAIARQFDVPIEAVLWRIPLRDRMYCELMKHVIEHFKPEMIRWDDRERDNPPVRPLRFQALARQALRKGMLSAGRYAAYLGISRTEAMKAAEEDVHQEAEIEVDSRC